MIVSTHCHNVAFNNENSLESYVVRDYGNIIIEVKSEKDLGIFDNYF